MLMDNYITQQEVNQFELLQPLLRATYIELQELSKKKPESPLNGYKVKAINRVIEPIKELFKNEPTYNFLDILDSDDLPTNSDVVLILSQYQKSMEMFKSRHYSDYKWKINQPPTTDKRKK